MPILRRSLCCLLLIGGVGAILTLSGSAWSVPGPKPPFYPPKEYRVGDFPTSVAIGDLNEDGRPDVAVANTVSNTMSVLLNRGRGRFARSRSYGTGSGPYRLAIGDLNRDGKADAAVANYGSKSVSVLMGRGDGSFEPRVDYPVGSGPWQVAIGDLNADGNPDLAVANSDPNTVSVLLNDGDGTFAQRVDYATGDTPLSVAIGDLNADGKPDLATANHFGNSVSVLLNRGDGTFEDKLDYQAGNGPYDLAIGDVNGDGKPDLATADYNDDAGDSDSVLLNKGDGSFPAHADYGAAGASDAVELTDLNGDGWLDLVSSASDDEAITVHLNHGDGTFRGRWDETFGDPMGMAVGDLNADGKPDIVTANGYGTVSVLLNAYGLCNVPGVRGMRLVDAERQIVNADCARGKIRYTHSTRVRRGRVISDRPRPGTVLPRNSKVSLLVSLGRR